MAEEGISALAGALPGIVARPDDAEARASALYGAWLCGTCLGAAGMALHHKLCHVLGGMFNLPHAETHAIILPHALAFNAPAAPEAAGRIARALGGGDDPATALYDLAGGLGAPRALRDIGMPKDGIEAAAEAVVANPYWNPRPVERPALRDLITRAWDGAPPNA
jgi:alcohol dehydrogenase class IV